MASATISFFSKPYGILLQIYELHSLFFEEGVKQVNQKVKL